MKIQTVHKNYAQLLDNYQLKLPIDLEIFIPEDDSVRLLSLMMEELDLYIKNMITEITIYSTPLL